MTVLSCTPYNVSKSGLDVRKVPDPGGADLQKTGGRTRDRSAKNDREGEKRRKENSKRGMKGVKSVKGNNLPALVLKAGTALILSTSVLG